jgi:hypothetical protein
MPAHQFADPASFVVTEVRHVEMAHPGITAVRTAGRPAHEFDATETLVGGERQDLI